MERFVEKMARKAVEEPKFQQSWRVHMGAFGPVLEGCFREDDQARIHLCAALNHISRRECARGMGKLQLVESRCRTEADRAAVAFFRGVCHQMAGDEGRMAICYREAIDRGLKFYMPYMKLAKLWQTACMYDRAERYYRSAISCYDGSGLGEGEKLILGSAYTGLATCLTMMHRYDEAERTLEASRTVCPDGPGRAAVEAVLHAALGREAQAKAALDALLIHAPQVYAETRATVRAILEGKDPIFCPLEPDRARLRAFWDWFREQEPCMTEEKLAAQFNRLFPQAEGALQVRLAEGRIVLPDHYFAALTRLCEELLDACPPELAGRWHFELVRYLTKE